MKAKEIRKATKNMKFETAINFIKNLGFELILNENNIFCKSWSINNNKEITHIFCTMSDLENKNADVTFVFNY